MAKSKRIFPVESSGPVSYIGKKKTHWLITAIQYLVLIIIGFFCFHSWHLQAPQLILSPYMVIPVGLSLAYLWTDVWRIGVVKPFTCISCMSGWFSLIIALVAHIDNWYFYAPLGVFAASIYSSIKMRWL